MTDRPTLTILEACKVVGVSRRTIYVWLNAGKLEYKRTAGGSIRIYTDSLWQKPAASEATVSAPA